MKTTYTEKMTRPKNIVFRFNPVKKLLLLTAVIILLLIKNSLLVQAGVFAFLFFIVILGRIQPIELIQKIRPLCYFLALIAAFHFFFTPGNSIPPFPVWKINVTWEGLQNGIAVSFRFFLLIAASSILTLTTPPMELAKGLETIFSPFGMMAGPVSRFSKMLVLTLQFIPVVFSQGERAFKEAARDAPDAASRNPFKKISVLVPVVEEVFLSSFQYAEELTRGDRQGVSKEDMAGM